MNHKTKRYMVLDQEDSHEYDIEVAEGDNGVLFSLFYSKGEQWTEHTKGTLALSMLNDGNGVKFNQTFKSLDYSELEHVRLLVSFEHGTNESYSEYKHRVIEGKLIIEL